MAKPEIAQKRPYVQQVEPGTYWWCACGKSSGQPFCDGSHKGTGVEAGVVADSVSRSDCFLKSRSM